MQLEVPNRGIPLLCRNRRVVRPSVRRSWCNVLVTGRLFTRDGSPFSAVIKSLNEAFSHSSHLFRLSRALYMNERTWTFLF